MYDIVIFGAGKASRTILRILHMAGEFDVGLFDNDTSKWGKAVNSFIIRRPVKVEVAVPWCVTIADEKMREAVRQQCVKEVGLKAENEIDRNMIVFEIYKKISYNTTIASKQRERKTFLSCFNGLGIGGVEAWTLSLFKGLKESGYNNLEIICDDSQYDVPEYAKGCIQRIKRDKKDAISISNYYSIRDFVLQNLPAIIITSQIDDVFLTACAFKAHYPSSIKIVSVIHNFRDRDFVYDKYIDYVDLFIGVSKEICERMIRSGVDAGHIKHMTCPFRCEKVLRREYTRPNEPICIGYSGRLDGFGNSQKRMDYLLDVCMELKERKVKYKLEIAGEGPAKEKMQDVIKNHGMENEVKFLGWIDRKKIPLFWKRQDLAIGVSDFEGRSISKLEAMANGAIPVVTDTSGVREDIIDMENGIVAPIGAMNQIADGIEYLYNHRELLPYMGKKAHDIVYPKSSMDNHIVFWKELLRNEEGCL